MPCPINYHQDPELYPEDPIYIHNGFTYIIEPGDPAKPDFPFPGCPVDLHNPLDSLGNPHHCFIGHHLRPFGGIVSDYTVYNESARCQEKKAHFSLKR